MAIEADGASSSQIYGILRKAGFGNRKRKGLRPLPCLQDGLGHPGTNTRELQRAWQRHFAKVESGYEVSAEELLQLRALSDLQQPGPDQDALQHLPCLEQFERTLRRAQPHRAAGPDALVPELCKYAAKYMAAYLYPLFVKAALYQSEPVHFKGGILCEVYKNKGPTTDPNSFRGILVSSQIAKCFHSMFRDQALPAFTQNTDGLHCGGRPGRPVEFSAQGVRLFHALCAQQGRSSAILFIDIKSAYYRLLRQISIGPTCSEAELCKILQALHLPAETYHNLRYQLDQSCAAEQLGVPPAAHAQAQSFHRNTWFQTRSNAGITRTLCGNQTWRRLG